MDEELLKGNFEVKHDVKEVTNEKTLTSSEKIAKDLKETVLQALGGSMVYVERTHLSWNGTPEREKK